MTVNDILHPAPLLSRLTGWLFRKPRPADTGSAPRKHPPAPADRFEDGFDETKPFFMQRDWRS